MPRHACFCPGQRPSSITTRIKTRRKIVRILFKPVRDHLPLQQGLRHPNRDGLTKIQRQRPSSITTRIKTLLKYSSAFPFQGQRPSSITTRIKTTEHLEPYCTELSETIFTENLLRHDKAGTSSALFIWL